MLLIEVTERGLQYEQAVPPPSLLKYRPAYRPPPRSSPRAVTSEEFGHLNALAAAEVTGSLLHNAHTLHSCWRDSA